MARTITKGPKVEIQDNAKGAKRGAKLKPMHPHVADVLKQGKKLDVLPDDFSVKLHSAPKREWFEQEHVFFSWKADRLESQAKSFRKKAEISKQFGNSDTRKKALKLGKLQAAMAALTEELTAQGIDLEALGLGDSE